MMAQSFDAVKDGLGELAMPVVLNELFSSSVLESLPTSGTPYGDVFTELRNGLHREGSAHKKSYDALRDSVQALIDQAESQGLGKKVAKAKAAKAVVFTAPKEVERAAAVAAPPGKRKRVVATPSAAGPTERGVEASCYYCKNRGHYFDICRKYAADLASGVTQALTLGLTPTTPTAKRFKPAARAAVVEEVEEDLVVDTSTVARSLAKASRNPSSHHYLHKTPRKLNWARQASDVVLGVRRVPGERLMEVNENGMEGEPLFVGMNKGVVVGRGFRIVHKSNIMLDSGATSIMSPDKSLFTHLTESTDHFVLLGDDSPVPVAGVGTINLTLQGHKCRIRKALYVPALVETLVSVSHLLGDSDNLLIFSRNEVCMYLTNAKKMLMVGRREGNLYYLDEVTTVMAEPQSSISKAARAKRPSARTPYMDWHCRLGHVGQKLLCDTLESAGIDYDFENDNTTCVVCQLTNFRQRPTAGIAPKSSVFLHAISTDMFATPVKTYYGHRWCSLIICLATRYTWSLWLKRKSDFAKLFVSWAEQVQKRHERKIAIIRGDGGELIDAIVSTYCANNHIEMASSPPQEQFLNPVERNVGIYRARAEANLAIGNLPQRFFNFAFDYALVQGSVTLHTPHIAGLKRTEIINAKTPFELAFNRPPDYSRIGFFGGLVAAHVHKTQRTSVFATLRNTLMPRSSRLYTAEPGLLLGFTSAHVALVYLFRTMTVTTRFQFRTCGPVFPGLSLQPYHLNPYLSTFFRFTGEDVDDDAGVDDDEEEGTVLDRSDAEDDGASVPSADAVDVSGSNYTPPSPGDYINALTLNSNPSPVHYPSTIALEGM